MSRNNSLRSADYGEVQRLMGRMLTSATSGVGIASSEACTLVELFPGCILDMEQDQLAAGLGFDTAGVEHHYAGRAVNNCAI